MEQVLILVILAGATHAFPAFIPPAATKCNAMQNTSCSATVGGSVYIQMMTNSSGHQVHCKKMLYSGPIKVFNLKREKVTIEEAFRNRTDFFISNGTFKINSVEKNDSGQYTIEVYDLDGVQVKVIHLKLEVQENYLSILILILVCSVPALILLVVTVVIVWWCCCRDNKKGGHKRVGE